MSLAKLRSLHSELGDLISRLESEPPREIDIATSYDGDPDLIASVVAVEGNPEGTDWRQVLQIFCSRERCPRCPHGDFVYRYRRRKAANRSVVEFLGRRVFSVDTLDRIRRQAKAPIAVYAIKIPNVTA